MLLQFLLCWSGALTLGLLLVLSLRRPLRAYLGGRLAYSLWLLPVLTSLAGLSSLAWRPATLPDTLWQLPMVEVSGHAGLPQAWMIGNWPAETVLLVLWGVGVAAGAGLLAARHRQYLRILRPAEGLDAWRSPSGSSPALLGVWRTRLVLPLDFEQRFSAQEQGFVLAHEQCHAARGDNAVRLLAAVVALLNWFNPLLWWAQKLLREDQEIACDAQVIQCRPQEWQAYSHALLKAQQPSLCIPTVAASWQSPHPLIERIAMLKQANPGRLQLTLGRSLLAAVALGGSATAALLAPAVGQAKQEPALEFVRAGKACQHLVPPEMPQQQVPNGEYLLTVQFKVNAQGKPVDIVVEGEPGLHSTIKTAVEAYECKPTRASQLVKQEFKFKFDAS